MGVCLGVCVCVRYVCVLLNLGVWACAFIKVKVLRVHSLKSVCDCMFHI